MTPKLEYKPIAPGTDTERLIFTDSDGLECMEPENVAEKVTAAFQEMAQSNRNARASAEAYAIEIKAVWAERDSLKEQLEDANLAGQQAADAYQDLGRECFELLEELSRLKSESLGK